MKYIFTIVVSKKKLCSTSFGIVWLMKVERKCGKDCSTILLNESRAANTDQNHVFLKITLSSKLVTELE